MGVEEFSCLSWNGDDAWQARKRRFAARAVARDEHYARAHLRQPFGRGLVKIVGESGDGDCCDRCDCWVQSIYDCLWGKDGRSNNYGHPDLCGGGTEPGTG
jgi:hypothetical protein